MARYEVTLCLIDSFNTGSVKVYELEVADEAAAVGVADALVVQHGLISDQGILSYSIARKYPQSQAIVAGANKDAGVTMTFDLGAGKKAPVKVQSPKLALFDANRNLILTNASVISYAALITGGDVRISDGETPLGLLKGTLDK